MHVMVIERDNTNPTVFGPFHSAEEAQEFKAHMLRDWTHEDEDHVTSISVIEVRSPS